MRDLRQWLLLGVRVTSQREQTGNDIVCAGGDEEAEMAGLSLSGGNFDPKLVL